MAGAAIRRVAIVLVALAGGLPARAEPPPRTLADLPGWAEDRPAEAIGAFLGACTVIEPMPRVAQLGGRGPLARTAGDVAPHCAEARALPPGDDAAARAFLEQRFRPVAVGEDVLTGYFEPELRGSLTRTARHTTPLHAKPPELLEVDLGAFLPDLRGRRIIGLAREGRLHPVPDRAAIMAGAFAGRRLELVWVDDPVDAFFLHIQGSGRVRLPDGRLLRLGYAAQNGHPYIAVGGLLIRRGEVPIERMSMQAIRAWMAAAGPPRAAALMAENPSYIFFRLVPELTPEQGPIGALGVPLTPGRHVAVDRAETPLGAFVWVSGTDPLSQAPLRRLTVSADVGGAIRGPARVDYFTGWGNEAAARAGLMRAPATVHVLVPR